ncbi:flagellin [Halomonas sp.]|uniref:flagellin n=1 Tax=Halomonas sp. TaxID=1486246 RepID=UPI00384BBADD
MTTINTNLLSLKGQSSLARTQSNMATAMERLSSGLRVNGAKDDAAGLGIANRMEVNLRANDAVTRGINDGISLMQTAEGGLDGINDILQRSRELAVQAANGTLSDADRGSINDEYKELRTEIDRIAMSTEAFGKFPLAPSEGNEQVTMPINSVDRIEDIEVDFFYRSGVRVFSPIPEGTTGLKIIMNDISIDDDLQLFTQDGKHLAGVPLGTSTWRAENNDGNSENPGGVTIDSSNISTEFFSLGLFSAEAMYDDQQLNSEGSSEYRAVGDDGSERIMKISFSGDRNSSGINREVLEIDEVTEPLLLAVTGAGSFYFEEVNWDQKSETVQGPSSGGIDIVTSARETLHKSPRSCLTAVGGVKSGYPVTT